MELLALVVRLTLLVNRVIQQNINVQNVILATLYLTINAKIKIHAHHYISDKEHQAHTPMQNATVYTIMDLTPPHAKNVEQLIMHVIALCVILLNNLYKYLFD